MIKRLRQYLDNYAVMPRTTSLFCYISPDSDKLQNIAKIHRKLFRSVTYPMKWRSLGQYFIVLCYLFFLHFRHILINLSEVVSKLSSNGNESFSI
ncbi:hypothetical protein T11_16323, partial [Trichinella zimbabwensis]